MKQTIIALLVAAVLAAGAEPGATPRRIVSLSPNVAEMLYGAHDQVVGISDYSTYPPDVNRLPSDSTHECVRNA